jgi:hypothetical protein
MTNPNPIQLVVATLSLRDRIDPVRIMTIIFAVVFVAMILWIAFQEM